MRHASSRGQYFIDVDRDMYNRSAGDSGGAQHGVRVPLPEYCGGVLPVSTERARTAQPPRPVHPPLPCAAAHQVHLGCANDHCFVQDQDG